MFGAVRYMLHSVATALVRTVYKGAYSGMPACMSNKEQHADMQQSSSPVKSRI
jgi:hypothetical protein